jgi:hypothetical protein
MKFHQLPRKKILLSSFGKQHLWIRNEVTFGIKLRILNRLNIKDLHKVRPLNGGLLL